MKSLLVLSVLLLSLTLSAQQTYIYCGNLVNVKKGEVVSEKTIIVEEDRIVEVKDGFVDVPENSKLIDLSSSTVLPGLFDMHVHLESETSKDNYIKPFTLDEADVAYEAQSHARTTLMAGFTSVRDLGGTGVNSSLRDAINKGLVMGPRIYSAGKSIATTGGHADPTNGYKADLMGTPGPADGVINGTAAAREAVRQRYKNGSDVIKITATGGVLSVAKSGQNPQFFEDEIRAIVETANDYGMLTAAHAHGDKGMQRAIKAGIKTIEHGTLMSEETMELMIKHDTYLVPTITAGKSVAELAEIEGYYPDLVVPKAKAIGPKLQNTFEKAYKKGVNIVFGTDAGVFKHGNNAKEFGYMVEVGMPAMEAIQSATLIPAKLLNVEDLYGSIEEGKMADIIAVEKNPIQNISTLRNVIFVMKGGEVVKP
ncbi:amidohydrolase family protein [Psychroflexus sp. CAK57W]|uniref:metal-dependent hydrolase family protein n=1 Tax=Psychroflexus curvus TaxID=2873595 RepID=UPI001CD01B96|nr:amidohydrolase family protein [Psychroflexus curvus]MBZ9787424.1 amidohydrolase family protein [Psychroflexus curvus]